MEYVDQEPDLASPSFLFLNESDRESATSPLKAAGFTYKKKRLDSSPANWETIVEILSLPSLIGVLGKITTYTFKHLVDSDYSDVSSRLLEKLAELNHVIFVHESMLTGIPDADAASSVNEYFGPSPYFVPPEPDVITSVLIRLREFRINIVAYTTNAELSVLAANFIEQNQKNLIFRVYVPSNGIFANEARKILELFHLYLTRVSNIKIVHEQTSTRDGIVHEFFADRSVSADHISSEFESFADTVSESVSNPSNAILRMEQSGVSTQDSAALIERFAKEARRLRTDIRHELETKTLAIRHRLEDALNEEGADIPEDQIVAIAAAAVPAAPRITSAVEEVGATGSALPSVLVNQGVIVTGTVHGVVSRELSGQVSLAPSASELMALITKYGAEQKQELKNALLELTDNGTSERNRIVAHSKLKTFALWFGKEAGSAAIELLKQVAQNHLHGV